MGQEPLADDYAKMSRMAPTQIARKRSIDVKVILWTGQTGSAEKVVDWIAGHGGRAKYVQDPGRNYISIETNEGNMAAEVGDWVLYNYHTERTEGQVPDIYPCKPNIFAATYELLTDGKTREEWARFKDESWGPIAHGRDLLGVGAIMAIVGFCAGLIIGPNPYPW